MTVTIVLLRLKDRFAFCSVIFIFDLILRTLNPLMKNTFYNDFDVETLEKRNSDYRTPFQTDRDRIIHSFAFRRLQAKTQVFYSGEYDFYRTRLTHSMEVAQIGRSICNFLRKNCPRLSDEFHIDPDLVEAACLSHDLGHPPFGHSGETILNRLMQPYGGFEGNAQTLRIITETIYSRENRRTGMKPTRAFIDSLLKYKVLFHQAEKPDKHFLYDQQKPFLDFVFANRSFPEKLAPEKALNSFRSVECEIMDWADDTAYSLNDMVDGIKTGFLNVPRIEKWAALKTLGPEESKVLSAILDIIKKDGVEGLFGLKIGEFIMACELEERETHIDDLTNRYRFHLIVNPSVLTECRLYKQISREIVFESPQLKQLEHKGHHMLKNIFHTYFSNYVKVEAPSLSLLPKDDELAITNLQHQETVQVRLLCDYIAGMTDRFAIRTFKRLFDPDFGSIV
ncbi:deoxyguanosinetriphosphate triphosphohydrolase, partial [candidate division KSB1 bacterium RBG_16_48_16]